MKGERILLPVFLGLAAGLGLLATAAIVSAHLRPSDWLVERRAEIDAFSPAQREELRERQKRFVNFSPAEQQRIRGMYEELEQDPQSTPLRRVMKNYYGWLKTLPAYQQAELHELQPTDRIKRIKRILAEQIKKKGTLPPMLLARGFPDGNRAKDAAAEDSRRLSPADVEALLKWIDEYSRRPGAKFLANLPPQLRNELKQVPRTDPARRHELLAVVWLRWQLDNPGKVLPITDEDLKNLTAKLSPQMRKRLEGRPAAEQWQVISSQIPLFMFQQNAARPDATLRIASEDEVARFFEKELSSSERDRILDLPSEDMMRELWRMYVRWELKTLKAELNRKTDRAPHGKAAGEKKGKGTGEQAKKRTMDQGNKGSKEQASKAVPERANTGAKKAEADQKKVAAP
ncbi:MAG: hypothetical protein ACLQNE_10720 [Thermoguttaceae bacterium]